MIPLKGWGDGTKLFDVHLAITYINVKKKVVTEELRA